MFTHRFLLIQAPIISLNQISIYSAMESFFPFFGDVSMTTAHTHTLVNLLEDAAERQQPRVCHRG